MSRHIKAIAFFVCLIMIFVLSANADAPVRVYVNGSRIDTDGMLIGDRTYIPLRAVSEAMGAEVSWNGDANSAFIAFSEEDVVARVVSDASPSVVTIIGNSNGFGAATQYNNPTMHGTGVVYKSNGFIITNAHVVSGIKNLTVVLSNGDIYPGSVLFSDADADLAIVKIDKIGLTPISMAEKNEIVSGNTAIAIGTPISLSMRNTVTKGIVSGVDVGIDGSYYKLIQTDAAINPGNSGGPLLNSKGRLIGINSSKFASDNIDNIGFAIPVDTVRYVIDQYEKNGRILRPTLNFALNQSWEAKIGLPTNKGVTVRASESPVLKDGDIITSVNGFAVHSIADWNEAIKASYNGVSVLVKYTRSGNEAEAYLEI